MSKAFAYETKLNAGMTIEGNSHNVDIPDYNHEAVTGLNEEFQEQYGSHDSDLVTAKRVVEFVDEKMDYQNPAEMYDTETGEQLDDEVPLEYAIEHEVGRCKEQAAVAQMLMQMEGVESRYVKAEWDNNNEDIDRPVDRHAFLKAETENGVYHADPTLGEFQSYEDFVEPKAELNFEEIEQELEIEDGQEAALGRL